MFYDTIIIGAGAAGLFAAANLKKGRTLVLEGSSKPGIKLLMAGSGMCNYTHDGTIKDMAEHYGNKKNFVRKALFAFDNVKTRAWFKERGIASEVDERGKVFPVSRMAQDLLNSLLLETAANGTRVSTGEKVVMIEKGDDGLFWVVTERNSYKCRYLAVCAGGKSYPTSGSDGSGFALSTMMGHEVEEPHPALAPVFVKNFCLVELSGISFDDIRVDHYHEGKKLHSFTGEMVITHKGFSGPAILDNARYFRGGDTLSFNYLHHIYPTPEALDAKIVSEAELNGRKHVRTLLKEIGLTKRLGDLLMKKAEVGVDSSLAELGKVLRKQLTRAVTDDRYVIGSMGGFNVAMATAGGVSTSQVTAATLESKLTEGLFFAGEVLDVDGDSGGYNIQWAFSSGYRVAEEISQRLES